MSTHGNRHRSGESLKNAAAVQTGGEVPTGLARTVATPTLPPVRSASLTASISACVPGRDPAYETPRRLGRPDARGSSPPPTYSWIACLMRGSRPKTHRAADMRVPATIRIELGRSPAAPMRRQGPLQNLEVAQTPCDPALRIAGIEVVPDMRPRRTSGRRRRQGCRRRPTGRPRHSRSVCRVSLRRGPRPTDVGTSPGTSGSQPWVRSSSSPSAV